MNILFVADMVGEASIPFVQRKISALRKEQAIDLVVANGENIHRKNGLSPELYQALLFAGVDVVTLGNHAWDQKKIVDVMEESERLVRPYNYPPDTPGVGYCLTETMAGSIATISVMGNIYLSTLPSPFGVIDALLAELAGQGVKMIFIDFHGEATSEKVAFGHYVDGRVSAVVGTHTHVQTADERILAGGTAYLTDAGMCGPIDSVIGVKKELAIYRFATQRHTPFEQADGPYQFNGVLITVDPATGHATGIQRLNRV